MKSIRISDPLYAAAEARAALMNRSLAQQLEHWARLGQAVEAASTGAQITSLLTWLGTNVPALGSPGGMPGADLAITTPQSAALQILRGSVDENAAALLCGESARSLRHILADLLQKHMGVRYGEALDLPLPKRKELAAAIERELAHG